MSPRPLCVMGGFSVDETAPGQERDELGARRAKLEQWRQRGVDPFGARFTVTHHAEEIVADFPALEGRPVRLAGRVLALRRQGRVAFCDLHDRSGRVQIFVRSGGLGEEAYAEFLRLDLGDIVGVVGTVMRTRAGEISLDLQEWRLLSKALRPLPDKWHGLRETETRYRRRYLDLIANPEARTAFMARSRMIAAVRTALDERGYLEVETPVLHHVASGAAARPFLTHHNALGIELHLRIALELHLKRLLVGGLERVYEIGRVFRNEGLSTRHNPEFTMLEAYQAYGDYHDMMELTESLVATAAAAVCGTTHIRFQGQDIDLTPPWRRLSMVDALADRGLEVLSLEPEAARARAREAGVEVPAGAGSGHVLVALAEELLQPELVQPTFLIDHPVETSPLARRRPDDPRVTCRFELIVAGMELANAFSELNDPDEQRRRFAQQAAELAAGNDEAQRLDEDFLRALEHGMPPAGGLGIGMDRLAMLLLDRPSIRDVVLFPQLRPEG